MRRPRNGPGDFPVGGRCKVRASAAKQPLCVAPLGRTRWKGAFTLPYRRLRTHRFSDADLAGEGPATPAPPRGPSLGTPAVLVGNHAPARPGEHPDARGHRYGLSARMGAGVRAPATPLAAEPPLCPRARGALSPKKAAERDAAGTMVRSTFPDLWCVLPLGVAASAAGKLHLI